MKRVLSLILCLVMCISFFSATATQVFALGKTEDIFTIEKTEFKNDKITYTISLAPNQEKLIGTIIKAEFDSAVLEVSSESGAVGSVNSYGEFAANVTGYYEEGITYDNDNVYSIAYMNPNGFNIGENGKAFVKIAFNAISEKRPLTSVKFYCEEYITDDGNNDNDISKNDGKQIIYEDSFFTLNPAENVEVASCVEGLRFTWTEAVGAEWYNIYRKEALGGDQFTEWELYDTADAGVTEYIDKNIEKGKEYYYSIESANEYGVKEYDKAGLVGFDFGTITEVNAELTERGAMISWTPLDYAVSYTVYRQAEGETAWKKMGDTTETSYEDKPLMSNFEYSYKVKAHHEKGYTADTADGKYGKIRFIANAAIVEYELNFNDIVINWRDVDGAVGYDIYRKATGENAYTLVATVEKPGYTDTDVIEGNAYSYKVRSLVNLETKEGSVLGEESFDLIKLPVVTDIVATLGGDNVSVSWEAVDLAESYVVLRQDNNNGNWFELTTVDASETKYYDRAVRSGKTYTYAIRTEADGMITKEFATSNSVYYLDAPTVVGVQNGSNGIEFSFNKVDGASAYNIYRKDVNGQFGEPIATILATEPTVYVDSTAVSGGIYVYGVQSVYGDVLSGISTSSEVCCLEEPKFKLEKNYDGIKLTWNAVPSAEKYIVYYGGTSKDLGEMRVLGEVTTTSFVYKNGISGRSNWFAVEAVCGETISTKTARSIYYFAAPVVELIENMTNGIKVRWNIVSGADSYILLRKAGSATSWTQIAVVEESDLPYVQYTDTKVKSGTKYTYTVKAYDGDEYSPYNEKGWSREYLTTPKIKAGYNYYGGPSITWSKVTGATRYHVYRKAKSKKADWVYMASTKSTSYVDNSAKKGTKYYYAVRAVDGDNKSYYSKSHFDSVCKIMTYTAALKVENVSGTDIKVSWNTVSGTKKYEVYRKAGSAKKWTKIKTTTSTSYTDKSVKNGTTYKYMVKALNSKSKVISTSDSAGTVIRCISAPKLSSAKSAKSGITIKWNKISGASGYYVYRKTGSGDYEKIATVKGGTKVSYLDKKAKKGKTYRYVVKAYYKSYTSASSNSLKIKDKY